jgi:hypothetical protein
MQRLLADPPLLTDAAARNSLSLLGHPDLKAGYDESQPDRPNDLSGSLLTAAPHSAQVIA